MLADNERWSRSMQATWESRLEEAQKEWEHRYAAVAQVSFPVMGIAARHLNLWSSASCRL